MKDLFFVNLYFEYELNRECILLNRFSIDDRIILKVAFGSLRPRLTTTTRLSFVISREQSARFSRNDNSDACRRVGRDHRYPNATFIVVTFQFFPPESNDLIHFKFIFLKSLNLAVCLPSEPGTIVISK
uniref:Uncharacterized protein n=1 Tax=Cacopsylla melanoneura TaxID=428564 RepID=A0A8D8UQ27_9HEMI